MTLRRELSVYAALPAALALLLAFGAIFLFSRMGPAIRQILRENIASIQAGEEMLAALARHPDPSSPALARELEAPLLRAERNVTEAAERPLLGQIRLSVSALARGESVPRDVLIARIQELIETNRKAMQRADADAQRLGLAGAWASAVIGLVSIGLGFLVMARQERRVVEPLLELNVVVRGAIKGDAFLRCRTHRTAPEVDAILRGINRILDERMSARSNS